jgi:hypothetical protein
VPALPLHAALPTPTHPVHMNRKHPRRTAAVNTLEASKWWCGLWLQHTLYVANFCHSQQHNLAGDMYSA